MGTRPFVAGSRKQHSNSGRIWTLEEGLPIVTTNSDIVGALSSVLRRLAMKRLSFFVMLAALLVPTLAAQSAFDGTWKIDMNKVDFSKKPDVFLLQNGMYAC